MKIKRLHIKNYKSIKELEIDDAQDALILVEEIIRASQ